MDVVAASYLLLSIGAIQGVVLSIFLIRSYSSSRGNLILGLVMLIFSFNMLTPGLLYYFYDDFHFLLGAGFPLMFLFGPGIYLYSREKSRGRELQRKDVLHLIPFALSTVLTLPLYLLSPEVKILILEEWRHGDLSGDILLGWAVECFHLAIYMILTHRMLSTYQERLKQHYSHLEGVNLNWLKQLTVIKSVIWSLYAGLLILYLTGIDGATFNYTFLLFGFCVSALGYLIGYRGLRNPEIFKDQFVLESKKEKYQQSGLSSEMTNVYADQLEKLMEESKPYRSSDLTLPQLSDMLEIPPNYLSQVINERMGYNFFDYVNYYRVTEAKALLTDPSHLEDNIIQIAYQVGFNSKSTFNAAFKKFTQTTPTLFRKAQLQELQPG